MAELGFGLGGVIAQEIDRLAHFGHAVSERLAGLSRHDGDKAGCVGFQRVGEFFRKIAARAGPPRRSQPSKALWAAAKAASTMASSASTTVATIVAVSDGLVTGRALPVFNLPRQDRAAGMGHGLVKTRLCLGQRRAHSGL